MYIYKCVYVYMHIYSIRERVVARVVMRILFIIGSRRSPGKEPIDDSIQVLSKRSPGK